MTLPRWAVLAAGLLGCAHDRRSPAQSLRRRNRLPRPRLPESARYFPLAVGNHWTYEATYLGERSTRRVEMVAFRDGSYVDKDGRALRVDREGIRDQVRYLLREPLTVGATWTSVVAPGLGRALPAPLGPRSLRGSRWPLPRLHGGGEPHRWPTRKTPGRLLVNRVTFAAGVGIVRVRTALEEGHGAPRPRSSSSPPSRSHPSAEFREG